jgi:hypothetical protein
MEWLDALIDRLRRVKDYISEFTDSPLPVEILECVSIYLAVESWNADVLIIPYASRVALGSSS